MVEPVSLTVGAVVAALVVKAAEKGGEELAEGGATVLGRLVGWLRQRFTTAGDTEASAALDKVEDAPDSPSRVGALARVLDARALVDPEFRSELERRVAESRSAGVEVGSVAQVASGGQNTQVANVAGSTVTITHGGSTPPARP